MNKLILLEVDVERKRYHLTLSNGSHWFVDPDDLPTAVTWIPTDMVNIDDLNDGSIFSHQLTNLENGFAVRAMKASPLSAKGK